MNCHFEYRHGEIKHWKIINIFTRKERAVTMGKSHKHFTRHDRDLIEKLLDQDTTARNIAAHLDKSERAVSYEVRRHRQEYNGKVNCHLINKCRRKNICWDCPTAIRFRLCKNCTHRSCTDYCNDVITKPFCKRLLRFPYVCNACADKAKCKSPKYYYKSVRAEEKYKFNVSWMFIIKNITRYFKMEYK